MVETSAGAPVSREPREDWLALHVEDIIDPAQPIIDAHHHLWDRAGGRYLIEEFRKDVSSGHNIEATVYIDCRSMYRIDGPDHLKAVGEVEFANGAAAMSASGDYGPTRVCAGIIGHADLRGPHVVEALEALAAAGNGRFRGIRQMSARTEDPGIRSSTPLRPKGLLGDPALRRGMVELARRNLTFDAFVFHPQIPEVTDLARAVPDAQIVLDHVGQPIRVASYADCLDEVFAQWRRDMTNLATCANVSVKIGGLGMAVSGYEMHALKTPPDSKYVAEAWRPFIEATVEIFGPQRCMFESNVPPDKGSCSYQVIWNAFKRIAAQYSDAERNSLFYNTASKFYRI
jgi:predicted TIM-barrel fold metal-dependent hydrolase